MLPLRPCRCVLSGNGLPDFDALSLAQWDRLRLMVLASA